MLLAAFVAREKYALRGASGEKAACCNPGGFCAPAWKVSRERLILGLFVCWDIWALGLRILTRCSYRDVV